MTSTSAKSIGEAMLRFLNQIDAFGRDLTAAGVEVDLAPIQRGYDAVRVEIDSLITAKPEESPK